MPEIKHGWAHMYLDDPADRKLLIESGVIWRCGQQAVQMAVDDLVAGMVPMNDKVPPEIAAIIQKIQESRAKLAPNGLDATPPPAEVWACPNGHDTVVTLTSRKGRVYGMCTTCHSFERGDVLPNAATPVPASVPDPKVDPKRPEPSGYTAWPYFSNKSICQYCKTPLERALRHRDDDDPPQPTYISYLRHQATKSETCDPADLYRVRHPVAPPDPLGRSRMKALLDDNLWRIGVVVIMLVILFGSYLVFTSDIGHAYLCDTPGSKVCQ
jgi:hypothetical protein